MRRLDLLKAAVLVLLGAAACSCGTREVASVAAPARPPADLFIAVTVGSPRAADDGSLQPARFVIEPGGQLRAATGSGATPDMLPPRTRQLTDAQVNQLYGRIVRQGLALPATAANPNQTVTVTVIVNDDRREARHDPSRSPEARALVERLRQLARLGA